MNDPLVSVIIPSYNGADHISEAIQSVLDQSYSNLEIIVVDDASVDETPEVVSGIKDNRLQYIFLEENRGADYARWVGLQASRGDFIAFLDQDDLYHREKIRSHVSYLLENPEIGFSYNSFFNLNHSSTTIRNISVSPQSISLEDLILGFPLPPSVWVMRREWAVRDELWESDTFLHGSEIIFCGRLFMAGCRFGRVDGVLNYRRYHSGRRFTDLAEKCDTELSCQDMVLSDPRCPDEIKEIKNTAHAIIYLMWAYVALKQRETELGQNLLRKGVNANPNLVCGEPSELAIFILVYSLDDESESHEEILQDIFGQFSPELASVNEELGWAVAQGYLIRGLRAVMWGRELEAKQHLQRAANLGAVIDEAVLDVTAVQLLGYESFYGREKTKEIITRLSNFLEQSNFKDSGPSLKGFYSLFRAFDSYSQEEYKDAIANSLDAVVSSPSNIFNRGVISILIKSSYRLFPSIE